MRRNLFFLSLALGVVISAGCERFAPPAQSSASPKLPVFQAKAPGQRTSFVVWGDSGVGSKGQWQLAQQIEKQNPDFMLHTGDLIYPRGAAKDYDAKFFKPYAKVLARAPFYGALGNHDVMTQNGRPFLNVFDYPKNGPAGLTPERNYWFDYGDARVVVLDSTTGENTMKNAIAPWVEATFRNVGRKWRIAVFHHPPYSSGLHGDNKRVQRFLVPALQKSKVDVVFNGHDHSYQRFVPRNGVLYVVSGAGGGPRYKRLKRSSAPTAVFNNAEDSLTRVDMTAQTLSGKQITSAGKVIDVWTLTRTVQ